MSNVTNPLQPVHCRSGGSLNLEEEGGGVRYAREGEEGGQIRERKIKGMLYADDICIVANTENELTETLGRINKVALEYELSISEKKSMVVAVNGEDQGREWRIGEKSIREVERSKYLGARVEGGRTGGIKLMEDRVKDIGKTRNAEVCCSKVWQKILCGKRGMERAGSRLPDVWSRCSRMEERGEKQSGANAERLWKVAMEVWGKCAYHVHKGRDRLEHF